MTVHAGIDRINETLETAGVTARFETLEKQVWTDLINGPAWGTPLELEIDDVQITFNYRDVEWALAMNL